MKKEILNIGRALTRVELKKINGGSGTCSACTNIGMNLFDGFDHHGNYGYIEEAHCFGSLITNVSITEAQAHVQNGGGWCCDSCQSAHWSFGFEPSFI